VVAGRASWLVGGKWWEGESGAGAKIRLGHETMCNETLKLSSMPAMVPNQARSWVLQVPGRDGRQEKDKIVASVV